MNRKRRKEYSKPSGFRNQGKIPLPRVFIHPDAKRILDKNVKECSVEVSGRGIVKVLEDGNFLITRIFVILQDGNEVHSRFNMDAYGEFINTAEELYGIDNAELKLYWHSHVKGGVFWSGIDDHTSKTFNNGWMLSLVTNHHGDYLVRLDIYEPIALTVDGLSFSEAKWLKATPHNDKAETEHIRKEIKEKVRLNRKMIPRLIQDDMEKGRVYGSKPE